MIPFTLWLGDDEIQQKIVKVKIMYLRTEANVPEDEVVPYVQAKIQQYKEDLA